MLKNLEEALDVAYEENLNKFDSSWGQKPYCDLE